MELGEKIRKIRKEKNLSLEEVAKICRVSSGSISQIENGLSNPSVGLLKKITKGLEISIKTLFDDDIDPSEKNKKSKSNINQTGVRIVKKGFQKILIMPGSDIKFFLVTPDLNRGMEVLLEITPPKKDSGLEWYTEEGETCVYIIEGEYEILIKENTHHIKEGDSIFVPSGMSYKWRNPGKKNTRALWIIVPPSF